MRLEEIATIKSKNNAAIVAPAGHGKTEMIVDLTQAYDKKVLLVTHTNAGIEALKNRLRKRGVNSKRYSITTIAGFCIRWNSHYPMSAKISDIPMTDPRYYSIQYNGAGLIFKNQWARDVLKRTYDCIIVDEYQDCILEQHRIFVEINKTVPVIVLGDPLQAIFGWAGKLVSWNNLCFERVPIQTYPWRWENTNPALGKYLNDIRSILLPSLSGYRVSIPVVPIEGCIQVMPTSSKRDSSLYSTVRNYSDVVYITKMKKDQELFSRGSGGVFQNDEAQGLNELFDAAAAFDKRNGQICSEQLLHFLGLCATGVTTELSSYINHIEEGDYNFEKIRKHPEFGEMIKTVYAERSNGSIIAILNWFRKQNCFHFHRKELLSEMMRALQYASENNITIREAAQRIRIVPGLQKKYSAFRMLSSRTVLSKGLEYDCVIVDLEKGMSVTDYYVALTRAKRQIILICDSKTITLETPRL